MNEFHKLNNAIKHYDWGSTEWIPRLTGQENPSGKPWAELWMGTHPQGTSAIVIQGKSIPLSHIAELPFMVKFLAAEKPLSVQAHPNASQARKGFAKENKAGIAINAPERNYRDTNPKPEIICALEPFTAMAGFRETAETEELLSMLPGTGKLQNAIKSGLRPFLSVLFNLNAKEQSILCDTVLNVAKKSNQPEPLLLCGEFAKLYPGDPGILSPLYLNVLKLEPFEAFFIPAGILHSYIHGLALECMSNSDNVLRGGLTAKHTDIQELFSILNFEPYKPAPLKPPPVSSGIFNYAVPCNEFSLYLIKTNHEHGGTNIPPEQNIPPAVELEETGDAIVTVVEGTAECLILKGGEIKRNVQTGRIERGESLFAKRRKAGETLAFSGKGIFFAAVSQKAGHKQRHANTC